MGGQAVWIEWVVWWRGVGQVVSEAQVTAGYLARRANTSGGHWDTGGGVGELRGGVVGRSAKGLAEMGGGGGAVAKTGNGFGWGNKTLDALQSIEIL
jgi:hypothetical protein